MILSSTLRTRSLFFGLLSLTGLAEAKEYVRVRGLSSSSSESSLSSISSDTNNDPDAPQPMQQELSSEIVVMTQRDAGTSDGPSTCYNLLEQHWTQVMDFRTVGMIATAMIVDFPQGGGFNPFPHIHCGLGETFVAIKPKTGVGSKAEAYWMFEENGLITEHPVEDGDVLVSPLGRVHTYYTRTPKAAMTKAEIPGIDPKYWSRHLVVKIQGHAHQLRAESTGIIHGRCMPEKDNIGKDLTANGGRAFIGNFDEGDPTFLVPVAQLDPPPQPQYAPPNYLRIDSNVGIANDNTLCDGLVDVTGSKAMVSGDAVEDAYTLTKCYMDGSDSQTLSDASIAVPACRHAVFIFVKEGTLHIATGTGEKVAQELDGITIPANSGGYKAYCASSGGCEVWMFDINTGLNLASNPHFGIDAKRKVFVEQSDYGKTNYNTYQTCAGDYGTTYFPGGELVNEEITVDWATGALLSDSTSR